VDRSGLRDNFDDPVLWDLDRLEIEDFEVCDDRPSIVVPLMLERLETDLLEWDSLEELIERWLE
jgi:hypothetical protein